jgi:OmpA-OmpF porin, OOP family
VRTRRFIRLREPRWPFFWYGLLPLLGMLAAFWFAFCPFAKDDIEFNVRTQTRQALDAAGFGWVRLAVTGQEVTLSGDQPQAGAGDAALTLARTVTCPTWLGRRVCATDVDGKFNDARAAVAPVAPVSAPPLPSFLFALKEGTLTLTGAVPSEAAKQSTMAAANALIAPPRIAAVLNQLTVTPDSAAADYDKVLSHGVNALRGCLAGQSSLSAGVFALRCNINAADEASIRSQANTALPPPFQTGAIELLAVEAVAACDQEFASLLTTSKIRFEVSSAAIDASSSALLDALAAKVKDCPGTIRIEGHTDNTGKQDSNMTLSRARAASVKAALTARGIAEARLLAEGFGPNQPIADNATKAGRAQNRRIEFQIVTF